MLTFFGILVVILSLSAHELGHAFAMKRNGVEIKEISLLGFGPKLFTFIWKKRFGDVPIFIKLIPLGAYVEPKYPDQLKTLSYRASAEIFGAGVLAQLLFCSVVFLDAAILKGNVSQSLVIGITIILACLGLFPKYTCHAVLPIGILFAFLLVYSIYQAPLKTLNESGSVVYVAQSIHEHALTLGKVLVYASVVSISIALTNMLPLYPMDGGRIFVSLFKNKRWSEKSNELLSGSIKFITAIPLMVLIYFAIKGDVLRIIQSF